MTLLITEADVRSLLTMQIALEVVEDSLRRQGDGKLILHPRRRVRMPDGALLHYMAAGDPDHGYFGMKIYTTVRGAARFVVPLYNSNTGEMAALIEADALGQIRTGAASGVATKYLANSNAQRVGIIGTGYQARTQLAAVAAVLGLERVRAFGRDIVITATSALRVVLEGAWLAPGMHIIAMGANWPQKRELDADAIGRCDVISVDSIEQAKMEAGDLIEAFGEDASRWDTVREVSGIVAGKIPGRVNANQITLFKSVGIAAWDLAAATKVFELAVARGVGQSIPLWENSANS
jgi:ornithine cyclodeaminase/alanine dehydrogenase-like protein (mu-crystallin family)